MTAVVFVGMLAAGLFYTAYSLLVDVKETGAPTTTWLPYLLLGVALLIALGFEFTMAANRSGLQMSAIRKLLMAWVLTLPAAILLSGSLYWIFAHVF
jgi:phosphate/sulfate permease